VVQSSNVVLTVTNADAAAPYDLYATTNLSPNVPGLNLTNWLWLRRLNPGETVVSLPRLPEVQYYYQLGTTNDTDLDGLTDAFENLVSHSSPAVASTRGDGMSDLIAYLQGRNPRVPGSLSDTGGVLNLEVYTPLK